MGGKNKMLPPKVILFSTRDPTLGNRRLNHHPHLAHGRTISIMEQLKNHLLYLLK